MKNKLLAIVAVLIGFLGHAASVHNAGDDLCKSYFPLKVGTELVYENFNSKDKLQATDYMKVTNLTEESGKLTIDIHTASKDKKGETTFETDITYTCEGGVFKVSMESMMNQASMQGLEDMEVEISQTELAFPSHMDVGSELPDATITMSISSNGVKIMSTTVKITDRKVEALETVETSAGSFECFKISQSTTAGMGFMTKTMKSVDWISENIGSVRSESYDEKGSLESYRVLKAIN